jgi:hypothetical protein
MKRLLFAAMCCALLLGGCGPANLLASIPPAPVAAADKTVLDEQGMLAAELAYKGARIAVETGVDTGLIKGATAAKVAGYDNAAFAALGKVRAAYRAANASSYSAALSEARTTIGALLALTGKTGA